MHALTPPVQLILTLGCLFLASVLIDTVGRRTHVPRVSLLMLLGLIISTEGLDLLAPVMKDDVFPLLSSIALAMFGFLLGERFTRERMLSYGREVFIISVGVSFGTSIVVAGGLILLQFPVPVALLLGGIAAATDPAATVDVIHQLKFRTPFSEKLQGVVALDDAWGLVVFSFCAALAIFLNGESDSATVSMTAVWEIGGAVLLGVALGLPAAYLTGRLDPGQPSLMEALGIVFICSGLSQWLDVSFLISAMVLGGIVANFASHHERPFHEIEGIEGPFLVLFFILAGASLEFASFQSVFLLVASYVLLRWIGKIAGAALGARISGSDRPTRRWIGFALSPQAGVAIGMALIAIDRFPDYKEILLPVVITSTVFFELVGPFCTRLALKRVC